ncbi:MAG: hypothetical protein QM756_43760 [Polyangiaceae bacterium]
MSAIWIGAVVACIFSVALSWLVRRVATRIGAVARPRADRWHQKPTALFGGVAFALAALASLGVMGAFGSIPIFERKLLVIIALSASMFVLGLVDDIYQLAPQNKLLPQLLAGLVLAYFDIQLRWTGIVPVDSALTVFWVVGITNAVNLLDNMDGLASGIVAIACVVLSVFFVHHGQLAPALAAAVVAGACAGFLVFNFNPASIFMGDCGSLFLGFFVSSLALLSSYGRSRSLLATLAVPVLILLVPIFDTTFVTLRRKLAGRPISLGGRDHTSHRLVDLGLSERRAVLVLWTLSGISGGLAILARTAGVSTALALAVPFVIVVIFVGVYLGSVKVDISEEERDRRPGYVAFLADMTHKRRVFEILLDIVLVFFSYCVAHLLRYDGTLPFEVKQHLVRVVPLLIGVKLSAMAACGLYRGVWKYTGIEDVVRITRAVAVGSTAWALTAVFLYRLDGFSRSVLVIDCMVLLMVVGGSRISFRLLQSLFSGERTRKAKRALIFGAGAGGVALLREIRNNSTLQLAPIGFVDDDARLSGRRIHDLRVMGSRDDLARLVRDHSVSTIIVSTEKMAVESQLTLSRLSSELGVELLRLRLEVTGALSFASAPRG